jgi:putative tryptophan/tyrosine transport system substrate-binding protein
VRRRAFISLLSSAAVTWPLSARPQQPKVYRVGALLPFMEDDPEGQRRLSAFEKGLRERGWAVGQTVRIDYRWTGTDPNRIRTFVTEIVRLGPDVILVSSDLVLAPLQQQTDSIPIVFTNITDPVGSGIVASLSRPGGHITGFTLAEFSTYGKLLELLKEATPHVTRVAVMLNPEQRPQAGMLRAIEAVAPSLSVKLLPLSIRDHIERSLDAFGREPNGGLIVLPNPLAEENKDLIARVAVRNKLPSIYVFRFYAAAGGLMSYGVDTAEQPRQAASYVDRILRGEKPRDLPVQQPTKFELVINLRTARALGMTISPALLARADEVIE